MNSVESLFVKQNLINRSELKRVASERNEFWKGNECQLDLLIENCIEEIGRIEAAASPVHFPETPEEAKRIKAIWVLSGAGTFLKPITETEGDKIYREKSWGQGTDKKRIDHAANIIRQLALLISGKDSLATEEMMELCRQAGAYLIYNGVSMQNADLQDALKTGELMLPAEKVFIPDGIINKTIDQVKNLSLPNMRLESGDVIGIVSHASHLARVMRMVNKFKPLPSEVSVQLFPLVLDNPKHEAEFVTNEILGIAGYISRGEATFKPYPYKL